MDDIMNKFLLKYVPTSCSQGKPGLIDKYFGKVPDELLELWKENGFGKYNDGLIEIINPDDYNIVLGTWLGKEVDNYVPIALSAFGDLFYYRKLTETDEDVCLLDIHFRKTETCMWSLAEFFDEYLVDPDIVENVLRKNLFVKALKKFRILDNGEIFFFTPALVLGGVEHVKNIDKGIANIHMNLLFQMT